MRVQFAKSSHWLSVGVLMAACGLPAHAGFFDDLLEKGSELTKGIGAAMTPGLSKAEFLAQPPVQQEETLKKLYTDKQYPKVVELATALADTGSPIGKYYLGLAYYYEGTGVPLDRPKALSLLTQAADGGDMRAQYLLGNHLLNASGADPQNFSKGIAYLESSAATMGDSALALGEMFEKGKYGQAVDKAKALAWYKRAPDAKSAATAKPKIAALEYELKPVPIAAELLAMPADKQSSELSELYNKAKYADLLPLAQELHEKGSLVGTLFLGSLNWNGKGIAENKPLGIEYWSKAAAGGQHQAEWIAGYNYLYAQAGFPRDEALGVKYLLACQSSLLECAYHAGRAHQNGWGGLPVDKAKALAIFKNTRWTSNFSLNPEIAKRIQELEPKPLKPPHQDTFVKVMEAAKSIGVRVSNAGASGDGYFGSGTLMVNGSIQVEFETGLEIYPGMKPKLWMTFATSDRRMHDPLRKRMIAALRSQFGDFESVFDRNSTVFNPDWTNL